MSRMACVVFSLLYFVEIVHGEIALRHLCCRSGEPSGKVFPCDEAETRKCDSLAASRTFRQGDGQARNKTSSAGAQWRSTTLGEKRSKRWRACSRTKRDRASYRKPLAAWTRGREENEKTKIFAENFENIKRGRTAKATLRTS